VFAGAHVIAPELLSRIGPGPSDIVRDLYMPLLDEPGALLTTVVTAGRWHDMGTPERFLEGVLDWARAGWPERLWRRSWISPEAGVGAGAKVRDSAVEAGARVGARARVERSILLPGARIGEGCNIRESIVGFGASVPPGTWVERRIIMPQRQGFAPGLDDSVVGGAVYTPFGPSSGHD
jgi:mannose-1-phosphate guanylyltransferase